MRSLLTRTGIDKPYSLLVWIVSIILLSAPAWADQAQSKAASSQSKITFDRYYVLELDGQHCGYARMAICESADQITSLSYLRA